MIRCLALTALLTMAVTEPAAGSSAYETGPGFADQPAMVAPSAPVPLPYPTAPPLAFNSGLYPCSDCHSGMTPDSRRRALQGEHAAIALRHAAGQLWCLDCHQMQNRDNLRLASGESLPFSASYRLCGQCHGEKLRDWQIGLHGKRTGHWNGDKHYLLCTHCHNPHDPEFKALQPQPPPARPGRAAH